MAPLGTGQDAADQVGRLERRLGREREARLRAEEIAEQGLRELFEKQELLGLLERIATQANLSDSVEATFRFALKALRQHCNAAYGAVFWFGDNGPTLTSADIWDGDDTPQLRSFMEAGVSLTFDHGEGLPGRVLSSGGPIWVTDVTVQPWFVRADAARAAGLKTGFAFPIVVADEIVAIVELFQLTIAQSNDALLGLLVQIGIQLGRVIERARADEKLRHDALHDTLTGLPNRRALLERMEEGFWPKVHFKLLLIDLDRFKDVNDTFGHPVGDLLLVQVAERLRSRLGAQGYVARLGGDELAALVYGDLETSMAVASDIIACLAEPFDLSTARVTTGCSIGLCCTDDAASVACLMQQSDIALYEAKRNGRGQAACYKHGMMEAVVERRRLEEDMRLALEHGEFHLAYQPVMTLADDRVIGYEALIRWGHPTRGLVSPADFIPLSEQTGDIVAIGAWVLHEACREAATWTNDRHIAVNVSSVQLRSPLLFGHLMSALASSGLPAYRLEIEVTETALIETGAEVCHVLSAIRELGVKVAMDDFGTGYSSLSHLLLLPFDRIKIDRSFIITALTSNAALAVLKGIVQIGRDLGVSTLAEGVETVSQRQLLKAIGCDVIQGYLIGKPQRLDADPLPVVAEPCLESSKPPSKPMACSASSSSQHELSTVIA